MEKGLMLLSMLLPVIIFYILDKLFNLKIRLIGRFETIKQYKRIILIVAISSAVLFAGILTLLNHSNPVIWPLSIAWLYHYLNSIPDKAIKLDKTNKRRNAK